MAGWPDARTVGGLGGQGRGAVEEAIPALGGLEVTLSLCPLPPPLLLLPPLPLWHQCPTRWYWKLVPVSGAVSPPRLPALLVALSLCVSVLPACPLPLLLLPSCEQKTRDPGPGGQREPLCSPREEPNLLLTHRADPPPPSYLSGSELSGGQSSPARPSRLSWKLSC